MIKKIILNSFGKFKNKAFEFAPVTVFYGKNESGKTTIFDAIMASYIDFKINDEYIKRYFKPDENINKKDLKKYIVLESDNTLTKIDSNIFKNILAIRAGDITLDLSKKDFSNEIINKLLEEEVNLEKLILEFETKSKTSGNVKYENAKKKLIEEKKSLEESIRQYKIKLEEIKKLEEKAKENDKELLNLKKDFEEKNNILSKLIKEKDSLEKAKNLKYLISHRKDIYYLKEKKKELSNLKEVEENEINNCKIKINKKKELENKIDINMTLKDKLKKEIEELKRKYEEDKNKIKPIDEIDNLNQKINEIEKIDKRIRSHWIIVFFLILLTILSGVLSATIIKKAYIVSIVSSLATFFFISKIWFLYGFTRSIKKDTIKILNLDENKKCKIKDLKEYFIKYSYEVKSFYNQIKEKENEIIKKQNEIIEFDKSIKDLETQIQSIDKDINDYLCLKNAKSIEELLERKIKIDNLKREIADLTEKININMKDFPNIIDIEQFEMSLIDKISKLEDEGISIQNFNEIDLKKKMNEIENLQKELNYLNNTIREKEREISSQKGQLSAVNDIIISYKNTEKEIEKKENEIRKIENEQKASSIVRDILLDIKKDLNLKFNELSSKISSEFKDFFPHFEDVKINSIEELDVELKDKTGIKRKIDYLSTGTKDMFLLSFRLLLAKKISVADFLIFDDAFLSLDIERIKIMLEIIYKFYKENNWQLIFFTIDNNLKNFIEEIFKEKVKIHYLEE
jgi:DNA sulfur modification protein DndD